MSKRNLQIEALRALLILGIVFFHFTARFSALFDIPSINFPTLADWGTIGVAGFFVISGYFLRPSKLDNFRLKDFLVKKLLRLYPAYLLAIVVIFISVAVFGLAGREVGRTDFLLNIPLLNGFIGRPYVDGAHWYITYLLEFTVILAVLIKCKIPAKVYLPAWLVAKDILLAASLQVSALAPAYRLVGGDYVEYIVIGLSLAELLRFGGKQGKALWLGLIAVALAQKFWMVNLTVAVGGALVAGVFALAACQKLRILERAKLLVKIGESSYVLYLFHQNLGYQLILLGCGLGGAEYQPLYALATMTLMTGAALPVHYYIEVPVQKYLQSKVGGTHA